MGIEKIAAAGMEADTERYKTSSAAREKRLDRDFNREMANQAYQQILEKMGKEQEYQTGVREQRAGDIKGRRDIAGATMAGAESSYMNTYNKAPEELDAYENAIREGSTREQQDLASRAALNLNRSGVRGGQAATLMNRQAGDVTKDLVNRLASTRYEDAIRRREAKGGYLGAKAQRADTARYSQAY